MTDYSKMSDFEINCAVSRKLGMGHAFWYSESESDFCEEIPPEKRGPIWQTREYLVNGYRPSNGNVFNPCHSWADAGPIILENCISMVWDCAEDASSAWWNAFDQFDNCREQYQSNPLRAAMIVFLMMQEDK